MDNNLILAPCSNEESKHNLRESVLNPVPEEVYSKYSDFRSEEDISIWGTKETNKGTWRLVEEGDVVLFYTGERTYEYAGTVAHTMVNRELANEVWGDGDQEYISSSFGPGAYKCLVFLTQVKRSIWIVAYSTGLLTTFVTILCSSNRFPKRALRQLIKSMAVFRSLSNLKLKKRCSPTEIVVTALLSILSSIFPVRNF